MEDKFQYQWQFDKYLEEWLYPGGSQPECGFFYEEKKQDYIQI